MSEFTKSLTTAAGAAIGGLPGSIIGNAVGGLFGSLFGSSSAKKQFQYQSQLQQQQFDLQKQMFDYTSAYNSPVNQVQRYKDAGLNPNLLTGQTQMAGSTGSIGQGNAPTPFVQMNGDLSGYIAANNQAALTKSEIRLKESQADLNSYKAITEWYNGLDAKAKSKYSDLMYKASLNLLEKQAVTETNKANLFGEQTITEIAKRYNIKANTMKTIAQGINESLQPIVILQQLRESQSRIETATFYRGYLSAAAEELKSRGALNDAKMQEHFAGANLKNAKWIAQVLRNGDYEKFSAAELAKFSSEVYKNFYGNSWAGRISPGLTPYTGNFYDYYND